MFESLGKMEKKFADIIWREEPLSSRKLSELAEIELGWKKTTSYTVLKRLEDKNLFKNEHGKVRSLVSRDEYNQYQSKEFIDEYFNGKIPDFLVAFSSVKPLNKEDIEKIEAMINEWKRTEK